MTPPASRIRSTKSPGIKSRQAGAFWLAAICLLAVNDTSLAQQPAGPPAAQPAPAAPAAGAPAPLSASALRTSPLRPSRYVTEKDLPAYVKALTESFSITRRAADPFGQLQDPNAKPVVKPTPTAATRRVVAIQPTSFPDIIRRIKVNTVMPNEKKFLIGTRTIMQGDEIPLNFRGRSIMVRVVKVSSRAIEFRNNESGETASLPLGLLPEGMKAGGDFRPPGMTPQNPNAPIDIDAGDPLKPQP